MAEADQPKSGAVPWIRAAAVGLAVAAACQTAAVGLASAAFVLSRPFDRPAQGPTGSMLFCGLTYCAVSWLVLAFVGRRAVARGPVPDGEETPAVRLAVSPGVVAAAAAVLAGFGYATAVLGVAWASAGAILGLADSLESRRFLGLEGDFAAFLGTIMFVVWAGQAAASAVAAFRRDPRRP